MGFGRFSKFTKVDFVSSVKMINCPNVLAGINQTSKWLFFSELSTSPLLITHKFKGFPTQRTCKLMLSCGLKSHWIRWRTEGLQWLIELRKELFCLCWIQPELVGKFKRLKLIQNKKRKEAKLLTNSADVPTTDWTVAHFSNTNHIHHMTLIVSKTKSIIPICIIWTAVMNPVQTALKTALYLRPAWWRWTWRPAAEQHQSSIRPVKRFQSERGRRCEENSIHSN